MGLVWLVQKDGTKDWRAILPSYKYLYRGICVPELVTCTDVTSYDLIFVSNILMYFMMALPRAFRSARVHPRAYQPMKVVKY